MPVRELLATCHAIAFRCFGDADACGASDHGGDDPVDGDGAGVGLAADAALYLAHAVAGAPMRRLAAATGRSPSTVLRAVRRMENRRDDPLLDDLLSAIEAAAETSPDGRITFMETALPHHAQTTADRAVDRSKSDRRLDKEGRRILRRLGEPEAFLALARGADMAVVFRKGGEELVTLARVALDDARGFAARDWISCVHRGPKMARYAITAAGRAWLKRVLAADGEARVKARGFADAATPFARQHQEAGERLFVGDDGGEARKLAVNVGETPLGWLARRRGPDGEAFLASWEVAAGERLREDFERAQMGPRIAQDWQRFLSPAGTTGGGAGRTPAEGPSAARDRVRAALDALGPGLNDAVLRACCFLEGLEATERRMGWSARSGKVVLKIALGRLAEHYGLAGETGRPARRPAETRPAPPLRKAG